MSELILNSSGTYDFMFMKDTAKISSMGFSSELPYLHSNTHCRKEKQNNIMDTTDIEVWIIRVSNIYFN